MQDQDSFFIQTVENCRHAMYRVAFGMLRREADAEDAVSSAVVIAYAHLSSLRKKEALPGYLLRCLIHACHGQLKQRKKEQAAVIAIIHTPPKEHTPIWIYLSHLPEKFRLPLLLRYGENLSLEDTASILSLPKGTVSSRCSRGLSMLRKEMIKEEQGHDEP
ncbi:MAG: RNA polymerase sigma factor [Clostridiales bacterium]|nr:RNA polymerase sigma factor [Clostridiales bacterium]